MRPARRVRAGAGGGDRGDGLLARAIPLPAARRGEDRSRDALKLAPLHAAGQLRPVVVAAIEWKAPRALREDLRGDLMSASLQISKLLLRHGQGRDALLDRLGQRGRLTPAA